MSVFKILKDKSTGKILLRRFSRRWEDIIRIDLKEIGINWFGSGYSTSECGIKSLGFISRGVS